MSFANQPTADNFKKNEIKTLQFLTTRTGLLKNFPELSDAIKQSYYYFKSKVSKPFDFTFYACFNMNVENSRHKVFIGANVVGPYSMCSYFLAIAGKDDQEKNLIRKFHFDYALPTANATNQPVPVYHLQYGGKLSPELRNLELDDSKLDNWLSLPRLNFAPINMALLLDLLFCELRVPETNEVVEDSDWRDLLFANEKFLSRHYYESITAHINSQSHSKNRLIRDFCYANR